MEDDSRLSSVMARPPVAGAGSHRSRGSVDSHASRSAQPGSGSKVLQSAGAGRGGTPPAGVSRDADATPPSSRPPGSRFASRCVSAASNVVCRSKFIRHTVTKPLMRCMR